MLVATGLQCVSSTLARAGSVHSDGLSLPLGLHCIVIEELASGPQIQPREKNQDRCCNSEVISNLWSLNPMFPPRAHYLCLQFYGDCRSGKLPLQMSLSHLFNHQTNFMIQLLLQSPTQRGESDEVSLWLNGRNQNWLPRFPFQ
ncbi:hypothetical protein H1C71_011285 [Ictidomys tridecemlineatus]|nr:hypothetical protein H1C71_011285 [Ictidomys tridecemlineatus]